MTALLLAGVTAAAVWGMQPSSLRASLTQPVLPPTPPALHDNYTMQEDATLLMEVPGVLLNDLAASKRGLTAVLLKAPVHGAFTLGRDGSFLYVPQEDFHGDDSFVYRTYAGTTGSSPATVSLTVTSVNDAPVAAPDSYVIERLSPRTIPAAEGLLQNDGDKESTALTAILTVPPSSGILALEPDGSFTFVPAPTTPDTVTFMYQASDGEDASAPVTVTLTLQ